MRHPQEYFCGLGPQLVNTWKFGEMRILLEVEGREKSCSMSPHRYSPHRYARKCRTPESSFTEGRFMLEDSMSVPSKGPEKLGDTHNDVVERDERII